MQTLVMIPGLGSDAAVWRRTIDALDGAYDCHVGDTHNHRSLSGMARRILDQAPPRFALAGVSMGGMVAMELMKIAPERVTHLALVDTNARPDTPAQKAYRQAAIAAVSVIDFRQASARSVPSLVHPDTPEDVREELTEMGVRVGSKVYVRQTRAVMARKDLRPSLARIAISTAVICGREDGLTPLAMSEEIHRLTPGSRLHIIERCGHLPPIEAPQAVAALLKDLIG
jgi:pimeloyl-ACP methyl ester carboxylesterase